MGAYLVRSRLSTSSKLETLEGTVQLLAPNAHRQTTSAAGFREPVMAQRALVDPSAYRHRTLATPSPGL